MSEIVQNADFESREARNRLSPRHELYWCVLGQDCRLGYYKGKELRTWTARYIRGKGQHADRRLGIADDFAEADGSTVMDFEQAKTAARNWFGEQIAKEAWQPIDDSPFNTAGPACGRL